jgi:hypothetical protein
MDFKFEVKDSTTGPGAEDLEKGSRCDKKDLFRLPRKEDPKKF